MIDIIVPSAQKLIKRTGTRDPFKICTQLGIIVEFKDLGDLKGMYRKLYEYRYILINKFLDEYTQIVVCAHELGHDQLHRKLAEKRVLRDYAIIQMKKPIELEAHMHAAETLLDDNEILEYVYSGYTAEQIAMQTCTYTDFIGIKLELLRHKGYKINNIERNPYFLKCAEVKRDGSHYSPC